jgi:hypothetical protein
MKYDTLLSKITDHNDLDLSNSSDFCMATTRMKNE